MQWGDKSIIKLLVIQHAWNSEGSWILMVKLKIQSKILYFTSIRTHTTETCMVHDKSIQPFL